MCCAQDLYKNFQNPPDDARPMMRWWWFGPAVTHDELAKELDQMHSAGIGGVEIQPVYPLSVDDPSKGIKNLPYLSPAFLEAVTFANAKARSLGMRVDITLGSGWPYGGPHTTLANAASRLRIITSPIASDTLTLPQLAEGELLIAAFEVNGADAPNAKKLTIPANAATVHVSRQPNQSALFFIASHTKQIVKRPSAGAEGLVLDPFSRSAVDAHLAEVATPLLSAFGPTPPFSVFSDSLEIYGADWTPNLLTEFEKRRGYDLTPHLPELEHGGTTQAEAVRHDWGLTLSELINKNYLSQINSFAVQHHTRFRSQTYGVPAVTLSDEATPQLPEGEGPQWRTFSFTRWAASASHLYGRNITSAETWTWLHSPAFRATPLDMKVEADRMFLQGVNQIIGHGWPYSPPRVDEPGWSLYAAAVFNAHNPWWPVMPSVVNYLHRASWLLRQGEPANDVAILLPEDDAQAAFSPGHVSVTDDMKNRITPELMSTILDAGYNVDYTDAATIDRLGIHHPILILPPMDRMRLATAEKIAAYAIAGGRVIAITRLPSLAPGLLDQADSPRVSATMGRLFHGSRRNAALIRSVTDLPAALHEALAPDLSISPAVTAPYAAAGLGFIHRKLSTSDIYFVVNSTNQSISTSMRFRAKHIHTERWSLDSGKVITATGDDPITVKMAPYESAVFVLTSGSNAIQTKPDGPDQVAADPPHASSADLLQSLDTNWTINLPGGTPQSMPSLQSWSALPGKSFFSGEVVYTHDVLLQAKELRRGRVLLDFGPGTPTVDSRPANAPGIHANLDPPIREAALVVVNGRPAGSLWHPPYQIDVSTFLHSGSNRVEVHVFNTAINELAGQPPRDYSALEARYGRRFVPQDMDNLKPLPSGLLGPVTLRLEQAEGSKP